MPKIVKVNKARKDYPCSECNRYIHSGESYWRGTPFRQKPIIRCVECGIQPYEVSSSEYVKTVGRIAERWEQDYSVDAEAIIEVLRELSEDLTDKYENLPDGLQQSETGELIETRIENLEDVIQQLEGIDTEYEDVSQIPEDAIQEYVEAIKEALGGLEY